MCRCVTKNFSCIKNVLALALFLALFLLSACCGCDDESTIPIQEEKPILTFAVAGHTYGNADHYTHSIYPPFLEKIKEDNEKYGFNLLLLTGDVLYDTSEVTWEYVAKQLDTLDINWFVSPGNHDQAAGFMPQCDLFSESCGLFCEVSSFGTERSWFIVLNTSYDGWTVGDREREVLISSLREMDSTDNLFVFTHQLWWLRNTPSEFELDSIRPNSYALYDGPSDFWQDVFPYFDSTGIETWFFAGDVGADEKLDSYYEDHHGKFHFYASGMGGGKADNYLIVSVYQNGHVDIEQVSF